MNLISLKKVTVAYGNSTVLRNVDLNLNSGEIVTIVGPNGSGKTTLLRAIIGSVQPKTGTITLKPGLKIGYVPQRLNFDRTLPLTVQRFLSLSDPVSRDMCIHARISGIIWHGHWRCPCIVSP